MGKEQELLEAARTGNVAVIERLLANRVRRSQGGSTSLTSALASLWNFKGPNVNCLDPNGETPLHLAALNGHRDVVTLLLQNEALVNSADERGCTPLHLAAWSGRSDICTLLLQPSAIPAQINSQNSDGETPLHCAAQHGHCGTVSVLLQDNSDPTIRNLGEFSPLDLAAQYGRLDVVKQLITTHPTVVNNLIPNHSPLHLASRSGHKAIVQYLLDSGFSVNLTTDSGTPLHEAATYCKTDVIKLLLDRGVNVEQKDKRNLTAADILKSLPSQKACEASKLISDHIKGLMKVVMQDRTPSEDEYDFLPPDPIPVPESELKSSPQDSPPLVPERGDSETGDMYAKVNKNRDLEHEVREQSPVSPDKSPPPPVPPRAPSIRCSVSSNESDPRSPPIACSPASTSNYIPMGKVFPDAGAKPKKPPRRSRDRPSLSGQDQDKQLESDTVGTTTDDSLSSHPDAPEDYVAMSPVSKNNDQSERLPSPVYCNVTFLSRQTESQENQSEEMDIREISDDKAQNPVYDPQIPPPLPPANPVRMNSKGDNSCQPESVSEPTSESLDVSNATEGPSSDDWSTRSEVSALERVMTDPSQKTDQSEKTDVSERTDQSEEFSTANSDDGLSTSSVSVIGTGETIERAQKPNSLEFDNKRTSGEVPPLSPTGYVQPPTPDYPPPSPSTAVQDIKQKINPQEKRKSKDMETLTEASILASYPEKAPKPKPKPNMQASNPTSVETKEEIIVEIQSVPKERIPSQVLETVIERVEEVGNNGEVNETEKLTEHVQLRQRISSEGSTEGDNSIFAGLSRSAPCKSLPQCMP